MEAQEERVAQQIVTSFGEEFIQYVLALPEGEPILESIDEQRRPVFAFLVAAMQQALLDGNSKVDMTFITSSTFTTFRSDLDSTLAQVLRRQSGGFVEEPGESCDRIVKALMKIARDVWPALLVAPAESEFPKPFALGAMPGVMSHPETLEVCKALMADEHIAKLFPESPPIEEATEIRGDIMSIRSDWVMSAGGGGTRQLVSMPSAIIFHAALTARKDGSTLTYETLSRELDGAVESLRALGRGETIELPVIVGLSGVTIGDNAEYLFESAGVLRSMRKFEREVLLQNSGQVTCVLETILPTQVLLVCPPNPDDPDKFFREWKRYAHKTEAAHRTLEKRIDRVRLSLLLASEKDELLATSIVSRYVPDLSQGGAGSWWTNEDRPHGAFDLKAPVGQRALGLYRKILETHPDSLDIAQRRLLSAVSQRWDPSDGFIDAVVVWENAFGTRAETGFRVTGAIAKLLEANNPEKRAALQAELKSLYGKRSALVHGGKEPSPEDLHKLRERAISIAIAILKELYESRADLLPLNSEKRSEKLLLEGL